MLPLSKVEQQHINIIQQVKTGDEKAFRLLYDLYVARIHAFTLKIVKSPDIADDIVQDVFIRIWELRETLDTGKSFQSFLFTIARNHIINGLKRSSADANLRKEIFAHATVSTDATNIQMAFHETSALLQQAMELLPPQQKKVFELCKINGLTYDEAAAELNISPGTVNIQIVRSMKVVREYFRLHQAITTLFLIHFFP